MDPSKIEIDTIPESVAKRMRSDSTRAARKKLHDLDIDGSEVDDAGLYRFYFRSDRYIPAVLKNPAGEEQQATIPIDGFALDPNKNWEIVSWLLIEPDELAGTN